ncbi:MAG: HD domain-containing phosphohydrolase, partial [Candidatus Zixiibacteriota bacterium]
AEAIAEYEKALPLCHDKRFQPRRAEIFLEIGQLLAKSGELDRALGQLHRALGLYRRLNDPLGICKSLRNLGVIYIELGDFEDAELAYSEAIQIASEEKQNMLYADLYNNLGAIKNMKGDWTAALDCYNIARDVYEKEGEVRKNAYTLNNIGITLLERGQLDSSLKNFISSLEVAETIKDASLSLILNINLTDLYLKRREPEEAKIYCQNAVRYLETEQLRNGQLVEIWKLAGKIAVMNNEFETARENFARALSLAEELGLQFSQAEILNEQGQLFVETDRHMEALQSLEKSLRIFAQLDAAGRAEKTENLIDSIEGLYLRVFEAMAFSVDQKDPYTKGHSDRVAHLSLALAQALNLSDIDIKTIAAGALLHDIGKLDIPDEILKKTGKLLPEEFEQIKGHPDLGVQRLAGIRFPWDFMALIRHHHEQFNGGGYPGGLSGEIIPLGARIVSVADVFDALTSERPYRAAFNPDRALKVMSEEMNGAFDPVILDTLISLVRAGKLDHIINRQTRPDELIHIWGQCRFRPEQTPLDSTGAPVPTSI